MKPCDKKNCTGCGLCAEICPKKCITMKATPEGFIEPYIDEKSCIDCNLCVKKCPSNHIHKSEHEPQCYLAWHKEKDVLFNSSSGGVFYALAKAVIDDGGAVVGAEYRKDWSVFHNLANSLEECKKFQKSKYVQSDIRETYIKIEEVLNQKRKVLFTGTPCQCAAMKTYFERHREKENLILCDLICHGVQSPLVMQRALHWMEKKYNSKCQHIDFRSKSKGWVNACTTIVEFENGKVINKRLNDIPIGISFLKNLSIRKCCETCSYREINREVDLTIGDFWHKRSDDDFIKKNGDIGYSCILVHSPKGGKLLEKSKSMLNIYEDEIEEAKKENRPLYMPIQANPLREQFFEDFKNTDIDAVYQKYLKADTVASIKRSTRIALNRMGVIRVYRKVRQKLC